MLEFRTVGGPRASSAPLAPRPGVSTMQPADAKPIRVLLVDDHQLLTGALSQMMSLEPDLRVVVEITTKHCKCTKGRLNPAARAVQPRKYLLQYL